MTTAVNIPPDQSERFLLDNVDWGFYDDLLRRLNQRRVFVTYDRGRLELMSPSYKHENYAHLIARMLEAFTAELGIPIRGCGAMTCRREDLDRGLEPDRCYYIANEPRIRQNDDIDLQRDPPPDLAVEVEMTRRLLDRISLYAALGVPELWRFDGRILRVQALQSHGDYMDVDTSPSLPALPIQEFARFLNLALSSNETEFIRSWQRWVRERFELK